MSSMVMTDVCDGKKRDRFIPPKVAALVGLEMAGSPDVFGGFPLSALRPFDFAQGDRQSCYHSKQWRCCACHRASSAFE